jgi:hypothetical protein
MVASLTEDSMLLGFAYAKLIPTVDEVIRLVDETAHNTSITSVFHGNPRAPQSISVDAIEVFNDCKILFASIAIEVIYMPPPSPE